MQYVIQYNKHGFTWLAYDISLQSSHLSNNFLMNLFNWISFSVSILFLSLFLSFWPSAFVLSLYAFVFVIHYFHDTFHICIQMHLSHTNSVQFFMNTNVRYSHFSLSICRFLSLFSSRIAPLIDFYCFWISFCRNQFKMQYRLAQTMGWLNAWFGVKVITFGLTNIFHVAVSVIKPNSTKWRIAKKTLSSICNIW